MAYIGFEGDYVALEPEVRDAMLDLSGLQPGEVHLEIGSGNGQFVDEAIKRGAISTGWEINATRAASSLRADKIINDDIMNAKRSVINDADVITFWFTDPVGVYELMAKLYKAMKPGARLVMLFDSRRVFQDNVELPINKNWDMGNAFWEPTQSLWVLGNEIHLFVR